jgi:hypothetical protein
MAIELLAVDATSLPIGIVLQSEESEQAVFS